jgi:8-oxo-dGTP pyrophosphatase MutT (NUDIX family)
MNRSSKAVPQNICRGIILDKEHVLLVAPLDGRDIRFLPGGGIEDNEDSEPAIRRELQEELLLEGVKVEFFCEFKIEFNQSWKGKEMLMDETNYVFKIENHGLNITETPPNCVEDGIRFEWHKLTELHRINLLPVKMIDILSNIGGR